jgi:hypothetical protein
MTEQAKMELLKMILGSCEGASVKHPYKVGEKLFVQTVTSYWTGRVSEVCGDFITLEDAAWIADTGRFSQAVNDGKLGEVEPVDVPVRLNTGSFVNSAMWKHVLPREQK